MDRRRTWSIFAVIALLVATLSARSAQGQNDPLELQNQALIQSEAAGKYKEAEQLGLQLLESYRTRDGADSLTYARALGNLAKIYFNEGRFGEALHRAEHSCELVRRLRGD